MSHKEYDQVMLLISKMLSASSELGVRIESPSPNQHLRLASKVQRGGLVIVHPCADSWESGVTIELG